MSSVIKMVLALEHKTIPPNINFKKPNPQSKSTTSLPSLQSLKLSLVRSPLGARKTEGPRQRDTMACGPS